jgi:hypothetical protein
MLFFRGRPLFFFGGFCNYLIINKLCEWMNKDFCYDLHHCTEMMATVVKLMAEKMKSHL